MVGRFDNVSRVLGVLVVEEGPSHVDRVARAPSKDLALTYIEEALRDAHSLLGLGREAFRVKGAYDVLRHTSFKGVEEELVELSSLKTYRELREALALIAARALSIASKLMLMRGEERGKAEASAQEGVSSGSGGA